MNKYQHGTWDKGFKLKQLNLEITHILRDWAYHREQQKLERGEA